MAAEDRRDGEGAAGLAEGQRYLMGIRIAVLNNLVPGVGVANMIDRHVAMLAQKNGTAA